MPCKRDRYDIKRIETDANSALLILSVRPIFTKLKKEDVMASAEKIYAHEIAKGLGYYATWLPTVPLELGDYGVLQDKFKFVRIGNIRDLDIGFQIRQDPTPNTMQYESSNAVAMDVTVSADVNLPNAPITTKVKFTFSKKNAVIFKANDIQSNSIEDQHTLGKAIMDVFSSGAWDKKHRIITELTKAGSTTIIIASGKSSSLSLMAKGDVSSTLDIANAQLGFTAKRKVAMAYSEIALKGLTPLFRTSGIRTTGIIRREHGFQPLFALKGMEALDYLTNTEIMEHPESHYFGLDGLGELLSDVE